MYVCLCYPITEQGIKNLIKEHKVQDSQQLIDLTSAGSGCGTCIQSIRQVFKDYEENRLQIKSEEEFTKVMNRLQNLMRSRKAAAMLADDVTNMEAEIEDIKGALVDYAKENRVSMLISPKEELREIANYILRSTKNNGKS